MAHKYYVVWNGRETGVFDSWEKCKEQVTGFDNAQYMSFKTRETAEQAFSKGFSPNYYKHKAEKNIAALQNPPAYRNDTVLPLPLGVEAKAWAVDAACSGNPGMREYRGIDLSTGECVFHYGPIFGTNNIGEFLAIVHAVAKITQEGKDLVVYSDSRNALLWYKAKKCKTKLSLSEKSEKAFDMIQRAERWLNTHVCNIKVLKWDTEKWGEIPADFGRK